MFDNSPLPKDDEYEARRQEMINSIRKVIEKIKKTHTGLKIDAADPSLKAAAERESSNAQQNEKQQVEENKI